MIGRWGRWGGKMTKTWTWSWDGRNWDKGVGGLGISLGWAGNG